MVYKKQKKRNQKKIRIIQEMWKRKSQYLQKYEYIVQNDFRNLIKEGPSFVCVIHFPQHRGHTFMTFKQKGDGVSRVCGFYYFKTDLLFIFVNRGEGGRGGHTTGHFLWMIDPLGASMKYQLYTRFIFNNYSLFVKLRKTRSHTKQPLETKNLGDQQEAVLAARRNLLYNTTVGMSVI